MIMGEAIKKTSSEALERWQQKMLPSDRLGQTR